MTGDSKKGIGNREQVTGNREQVIIDFLPSHQSPITNHLNLQYKSRDVAYNVSNMYVAFSTKFI
ncbi:hypothetical protein H5968_13830 [Sphaerospermopsis sp. LEGE 00249]|uniref:hypothetical protein n=1 Tax=Sphaerospermopsis sp. LEGE 00249 TaxID=1380707 RepID=UPI00164E1268|nr:hypothetical protein [Sphaerospermopsis sp. LEGE 00249]MBC5796196.1 hypothetical protein [Sphaerospermopsis sp. LEGE 00249]